MNRFRVVRALLVTIAVLGIAGLLASLSVSVYGGHRLASVSERYEREVGPLPLQSLSRPRVAAEDNAVTWLRPGVLAAVFFPGDMDVVGSLSAKRFGSWTPQETAKLETILLRNEPATTLLDRARGMKASNWDIPYEQGSTAKIPNLLAAIHTAKLLNARGRLALGRGDRETAVRSVETLGALARSHEAESSLIVLLIGLAIEKLQVALVHEFAASSLTSPADLDRLEASLCDADLKRATRESLRGAAVAAAHDGEAETLLETVGFAIPGQLANALSDLVAANVLEAHLAADRALGRPITAPLVAVSAKSERGWWWDRLPLVVGGNLASASARATATASARDLARLAIALRREARGASRYPATLPAIDGVPEDDPLTGGPRTYVVNPDGSAELRSSTTLEIIRSIAPGSDLRLDALYRWTLPAPR